MNYDSGDNVRVIKLTCPECGGNIEIENDRSFCFCKYCGARVMLDDESHTVNINKNIYVKKDIHNTKRYIDDAEIEKVKAEERKNKSDNVTFLIMMGILVGIMIFCFLMSAIEENKEERRVQKEIDAGKIQAGYYGDLEGEDYKSVVAHFESAGFTDIELIDLDDSGIAFWTNEEVESISIGGNTKFTKDDWFYPDTKVVISYH